MPDRGARATCSGIRSDVGAHSLVKDAVTHGVRAYTLAVRLTSCRQVDRWPRRRWVGQRRR